MSSGEPTWAERWGKLSPRARSAVLHEVKAPGRKDSTRPPFITVQRLAPDLIEELTASGLVERRPGLTPRQSERLVVPPDAVDFVHWVQGLARWRLLEPDGAERLPDGRAITVGSRERPARRWARAGLPSGGTT